MSAPSTRPTNRSSLLPGSIAARRGNGGGEEKKVQPASNPDAASDRTIQL